MTTENTQPAPEAEIYDLPEWAAPAIINGDYSGLNAEEIQQVTYFLAFNEGMLFSIDTEKPSYFCWHPAFGKAATCVELEAVYMK